MKQSWRDRVKSVEWKQGAGTLGGYAKKFGQQMKETKLESPIRSVGVKLFILVFCGILLCVVSLGLFSYSKSRSVIEKKVSESSMETAKQVSGRMDLLLTGYERKSMEFLSDSEFISQVGSAISSTDDFERFDNQRTITTKLSNVMISDNSIAGIFLLPTDPSMAVIGSSNSGGVPDMKENPPAFLDTMKQAAGKVVWVPTMATGITGKQTAPTIAVGRALMNVNSGNPYLLVIELSIKSLQDMLSNVSFGDGSSTYIVAPDGTIVYAADAALMGQKYEYELPDASGEVKIKADGREMLSVGSPSVGSSGWTVVGNIPTSSLVKDAKVIRNLTFLMCGLSVLIAALIGLFIMWTVGKPLGQLRHLMNQGERGNLTVRSTIRQKDEIGQVSDSFNRMMERITELVRQTNQSASEVLETASSLTLASTKTASAAKEIAVATEEIAGGATNLAVESERGSEMTGQIGDKVVSVIDSNLEMGKSAYEVEEAGRKGTQYMAGLMEKTGHTEEMTRSMVDKVDKLKESTGSISKILDVLGNMTKQTNILSLNATIEAARAGAAGRGFMVVADEIRKLADQSRQSIGVVGEIVDRIGQEIDETVSVLSDAYPLFREQIEAVRDANKIFENVQSHMSDFNERLHAATASVSQLEQAQETLTLTMTNVSAVAQQASATSEQVASLSNEQLGISDGLVQLSNKLETVSQQLRQSLSQFTVA
ncbi:methyl-accepting chemotaxis protein [Cohnella hashimotonis]|uniref:Methyl-accepting chemotaxis protein n=1 Tax=Cohnella hashimotonis TaxID=2826895 RepID=A0ABT6TKB3_9BACL|nr:methyl-accepting chemotaxis protein [Cohnella hashimotonis]MDI4646735.1 methyl-accepting chemotaxis protein [Cohnella hashimotonis]